MDRYVLIGLDGSGKSANLNLMKQDDSFRGFQFAWVRWEPKLLAPLYRRLRKKVKENGSKIGQEASPSSQRMEEAAAYHKKQQLKKKLFSNPVVGAVWMMAALTDYLLQFYSKYRVLKKSGGNIVFDRYYFDLIVDQGLNIGYSPERIARAARRCSFLFPDIKKVIYIRVPPEICFSRKDDIPDMEYLLCRFDVYERMSQENGWLIIDGEQPLDTVYQTIRVAVLEL